MLNNVCLVGRLTKDVEFVRGKEVSISNFSLAYSQGKNADGSDNTGFVECKAFGKLGETVNEWLSKGDKIAIGGRLSFRKFQRKDGTNGSITEIIVDSLEFIDVLKSQAEEEEELPFDKAEEVKAPEKPVAKTTRRSR